MTESPLVKYAADVQFPVGTPIDPSAARIPPDALKSYQFIERFTAKDTAPIMVTDDASQVLRDAQVVKMTRSILGGSTQGATDLQVLQLHRDYMAGRY